MPFICMIRSDIDAGILQVVDLQPNESQRNLIYEPRGQNKYVNRCVSNTVATSGAGPITTNAAYAGVAAWLIDSIENVGTAAALTAAQANTISTALIARLDAGLDLDTASVNTVIQLTVAASGIGLGTSVGVLTDLLKIFAGGEFILPAGTAVEDIGNLYVAAQKGAFTTGQYLHTRQSGALEISLGDGDLAEFTAATYSYGGVAGAALVLLDDDGTVKTAVP